MTVARRMMAVLPRPVARMIGRLVLKLSPGIRHVHAQVATYALAWEEANEAAMTDDALGPLWVVLGDSTAQGIGAHGHEHGYVGQVRSVLEERDGRAWRILNLSRSGARSEEVVDAQLPRLQALSTPPDLVTCAVGANDLVRRTPPDRFQASLREIMASLPAGAVVATLPRGLRQEQAVVANKVIRSGAESGGLLVADVWAHTGGTWQGRLAADGFHPNAKGYEAWAAAFLEALAGDAGPAGGT